mmetsp:Transcript_49153/g.139277  ORF Transcript_49153/g.139277 Transcript_49153/m.139277 type:complete len:262 (+) Transcript_49153:852-1637(+)
MQPTTLPNPPGFIETVEHYSKTCQNPKLDRNRQCFNEYTEILGQGRVAVAQEKLATLDVIGTTETFDDFMIALSIRLGWPLDWVTYKRLKTVLDRPKVSDHSEVVLNNFKANMADDITVYAYGVQLAQAQIAAIPNMLALRQQFEMLQAKVDQSCEFKAHSDHFVGKDCYKMTTKGNHGAEPPQQIAGPQAPGGTQQGGAGGSAAVGLGLMQLQNIPRWCVETASTYSVVPGKSWGSLIDTKVRRDWSHRGCDDAFAAASA